MKHLYTTTEIAQLIIFIENNSGKLSFSQETYKGRSLDKKDIEEVQNELSKKMEKYKHAFEFDFYINEKSKNYIPRKFRPIEAHSLVFFMLYPSNNYSFLSRAKSNKDITSDELFKFYNELRTFLKDERFKENGAWYNFEKEMLKQLPQNAVLEKCLDLVFALETSDEYIDSCLRQAFNFTLIKYLKEEIERKSVLAIKTGLEELIPNSEFSLKPFITSPDIYYDIDESENSYQLGYLLKSGSFEGMDYEWATKILGDFEQRVTDTILYLFSHLHVKPITEEELNQLTPPPICTAKEKIDYITQLLKK